MGAVTDRMKQVDDGSGADNLEDAIGDFAGNGELDGKDASPPPAPQPREKADCVILGYRVDKEGRLSTLVLGTAHLGRLVYAGHVTPRFDDDADASELLAMLSAVRSHNRYVAVEAVATWVKPKYACRVTFAQRRTNGILTEIKWDAFLGTLRTQ
jgi:ATP-dependent DNA ligase